MPHSQDQSANTITGPVSITNNSGSGLSPEDSTPEFENNHVTAGTLACTANTSTLTQTANTVTGPRTGQCQQPRPPPTQTKGLPGGNRALVVSSLVSFVYLRLRLLAFGLRTNAGRGR